MAKRTKSDEMAELCARVDRWREQSGGRGSRVPDVIWRAAVRMAGRAGVYATARASRLNYYRLKERREQAQGPGALVPDGAAASDTAGQGAKDTDTLGRRVDPGPTFGPTSDRFVAVQLPAARTNADRHATIEVVSRHGARMRVEVRGDIEICALLHTFWAQTS